MSKQQATKLSVASTLLLVWTGLRTNTASITVDDEKMGNLIFDKIGIIDNSMTVIAFE